MTGTAHLSLAIELNSDPISGSVSNGIGDSQVFTGWIELASVIEAARSRNGGTPGKSGGKTLGSFPGANHRKL
jgi:hypothetical protein